MARRRVLAWALALAVVAAVFAAYLRPDLMRDLSDFLWSCF
jgi:hypothetical protein